MDVAVGLPTVVPGIGRQALFDWARRADQAGFSSLGAIDRLVWDNWDAVTSLTAAAAVTERIKLLTCVLLAPLHGTAVLAKQLATLDQVAGANRLWLGMAVGGRDDDYVEAEVAFDKRGERFDGQLAYLSGLWDEGQGGSRVGPRPATQGSPGILIGGASSAAIRRATAADGWIAGGGGPQAFSTGAERVRAAWEAAGRTGAPRLVALAYVSLHGGRQRAEEILGSYYAFAGPLASRVVDGTATTVEQTKDLLRSFADAGCDEVVLVPCSGDADELDRIADARSL